MKVIRIAILLITAIVIAIVFYLEYNKKETKVFKTISPKLSTIERNILIQGEILPSKEIFIKSNISGIVDKLLVSIGDYVSTGQPIAQIKAMLDPVSLERLERQYNSANILFKSHKANFVRSKQMYSENLITSAQFEESEKTFLMSKHDVESLKRELELTDERGQKSGNASNTILSTIDGTILELPVKVGGAIMSRTTYHEGTTLATIANLKSLVFHGKILESDVDYLTLGMRFDIVIGALKDQKVEAILTQVAPKGNVSDGSVKFDIYASILLDQQYTKIIRAGYSANAEIVLEKKDKVLVIEEKYVQFDNDSTFVELVQGNALVKRNIDVGISNGFSIEVTKGITSSDKLRLK